VPHLGGSAFVGGATSPRFSAGERGGGALATSPGAAPRGAATALLSPPWTRKKGHRTAAASMLNEAVDDTLPTSAGEATDARDKAARAASRDVTDGAAAARAAARPPRRRAGGALRALEDRYVLTIQRACLLLASGETPWRMSSAQRARGLRLIEPFSVRVGLALSAVPSAEHAPPRFRIRARLPALRIRISDAQMRLAQSVALAVVAASEALRAGGSGSRGGDVDAARAGDAGERRSASGSDAVPAVTHFVVPRTAFGSPRAGGGGGGGDGASVRDGTVSVGWTPALRGLAPLFSPPHFALGGEGGSGGDGAEGADGFAGSTRRGSQFGSRAGALGSSASVAGLGAPLPPAFISVTTERLLDESGVEGAGSVGAAASAGGGGAPPVASAAAAPPPSSPGVRLTLYSASAQTLLRAHAR
jgi:hypothetical protein